MTGIELTPGEIGCLEIPNRFVRSATQETLADGNGYVDADRYTAFYERLARGGVGLIFTGHCFVAPAGRYTPGMAGVATDAHAERLSQVVPVVQRHGAKIFVELNHAGGQSRVPTIRPVAPSPVANRKTGRTPRALSGDEIEEILEAFAAAAERVQQAGFDGIHVHAGHGYLLSSFLSPHSNRRTDEWGGRLENRQRLLRSTIAAIRQRVGADFPVTVKLGLRDFAANGLSLDDGIATAGMLDGLGVDAIEPSAGLTSSARETTVQYAGVSRRRAVQDGLYWRALARPRPEGYFLDLAKAIRRRLNCKLILSGGVRSVGFIRNVLDRDLTDFVSLARPLIREPDLVRKIAEGRTDFAACTSCNICSMHDGIHELQCWRTSKSKLLEHAYYRLTRQLTFTGELSDRP